MIEIDEERVLETNSKDFFPTGRNSFGSHLPYWDSNEHNEKKY